MGFLSRFLSPDFMLFILIYHGNRRSLNYISSTSSVQTEFELAASTTTFKMIGDPQYKIMGILLFRSEFCFCQIKEEKAREKNCLQKIHCSQDEILP